MTPKKRFRITIPYWWLLSPIVTVAFILGVSALIIAYGRGYRFRPTQEKILNSTGLLAATSDPVGAQLYIDGVLKSATNASPNVEPGKHTIKIAKDGYLSWQKDIVIEKEIVSNANAFLFPINPSLSPLTNSGIITPTLSPDGTKIAYISPSKQENENTLWMYELADKTLGFNRDPKKVADIESEFSPEKDTLRWSPDSTEILLITPSQTRRYKTNRANDVQIMTLEKQAVFDEWDQETQEKQKKQLTSFKQPIINLATSSATIIAFSPDETKILYEATASATIPPIITPPLIGTNSTVEERSIRPGNLYVYDSKEDKNYFLLSTKEIKPSPSVTPSTGQRKITPTPLPGVNHKPTHYPIHWFPTNKHLILTINGKIDILEYDRTNWVTVYAGPFSESFVAPWPGGSRIVIVTNLNPGSSPLPNLYTVNLR